MYSVKHVGGGLLPMTVCQALKGLGLGTYPLFGLWLLLVPLLQRVTFGKEPQK